MLAFEEAVATINLREYFTARKIAKFAVGSSIRFIVSSSIATLVPTETRVEKTKVFIGSHMIAGVIAKQACERVDEFFDGLDEANKSHSIPEAQEEESAIVIHTMSPN